MAKRRDNFGALRLAAATAVLVSHGFGLTGRTDPVWRAYWTAEHSDGPVVRTVHECLQAVLWNGTVGLTPIGHALPDGLAGLHGIVLP